MPSFSLKRPRSDTQTQSATKTEGIVHEDFQRECVEASEIFRFVEVSQFLNLYDHMLVSDLKEYGLNTKIDLGKPVPLKGFSCNMRSLLEALHKGDLYGLCVDIPDLNSEEERYSAFQNKFTKLLVPNLWDYKYAGTMQKHGLGLKDVTSLKCTDEKQEPRRYILPVFCWCDKGSNAVEIIWTDPKLQKRGLAKKLLKRLKEEVGFVAINQPIRESESFWKHMMAKHKKGLMKGVSITY